MPRKMTADSIAISPALAVAQGVLFLAGVVALGWQSRDLAQKNTPAQVSPWTGGTLPFLLLASTLVLTFVLGIALFSQILHAAFPAPPASAALPVPPASPLAERGHLLLAASLAGQAATLALLFVLPRQLNPDFCFQTGPGGARRNSAFAQWSAWHPLAGLVGGLALVGGGMALQLAFDAFLKHATGLSLGLDKVQNSVELVSQNRGDAAFIALSAATIVVAAPLVEELFFRGLVYPFLKARLGAIAAVGVTGVVFGAIHCNAESLTAFFPLALFGAYLCVLYEKTGDIRVPILVHGLFNLNTVATLLLQTQNAG
jgi:membrane protease YdiL (CAAX protease family)